MEPSPSLLQNKTMMSRGVAPCPCWARHAKQVKYDQPSLHRLSSHFGGQRHLLAGGWPLLA